MASMQHLPAPGVGQPNPSEDLKAVLEVARGQVAQEFQIAERLDNKARNQVALAGTWYALAQVIAGIAFRLHPPASTWSVLIGVFASFAAFAVAMTMLHSYRVWQLRVERDFTPDAIKDMLDDAEADRPVIEAAIRTYAETLRLRRSNNADRDEAFVESTRWWLIGSGLTLCEILIALAAVLFR